jgi:hypothetical protein
MVSAKIANIILDAKMLERLGCISISDGCINSGLAEDDPQEAVYLPRISM